jgi:hypothetical protein
MGCGDNNPSAPSTVVVGGKWIGIYNVTRCSDTSTFDLCPNLIGGSFTLTLVQSGSSLSGTMVFGQINGSVTGSATSTGAVTLNPWSHTTPLVAPATAVWRVSAAKFQVAGNSMSGSFHVNVTSTASFGALDFDANLVDVVR